MHAFWTVCGVQKTSKKLEEMVPRDTDTPLSSHSLKPCLISGSELALDVMDWGPVQVVSSAFALWTRKSRTMWHRWAQIMAQWTDKHTNNPFIIWTRADSFFHHPAAAAGVMDTSMRLWRRIRRMPRSSLMWFPLFSRPSINDVTSNGFSGSSLQQNDNN